MGIRGGFFECGRITKADDVVDWIFGLMRAVRDACPYNVIATKFAENREHIDSLCKKMRVFWGYVVCFWGKSIFSAEKKTSHIARSFEMLF